MNKKTRQGPKDSNSQSSLDPRPETATFYKWEETLNPKPQTPNPQPYIRFGTGVGE